MTCCRPLALLFLLLTAGLAEAAPVLMISIDGLQPGDVILAGQRGIKVPNLAALMADGVYASGVRGALPTVTYPNHTTLITGVWPARHGIANNPTFDPLQTDLEAWYWYASDIRVGTLWDAVHRAGGGTAALSWPASVGADAVDWNIPEYWRSNQPGDAKLLRALASRGLPAELEQATGLTMAQAIGTSIPADEVKAQFAAALIAAHHPRLFTLHLASLDHEQHESGPDSAAAIATLEKLDAMLGRLLAAARRSQPDLVVAVVSDHGFAAIDREVNLLAPFVEAGLITYGADGRKPTAWQAMPWGGASAAVILAHPDDAALKAKVAALLARLAADPDYAIDHVADADEIARIGGTPMASFWIDFKPGTQAGRNPAAAKVTTPKSRGMHGYFPSHPEMRASFFLAGPGVAKTGSLGDIDMRDIAPTIAKILGVSLPDADGRPLY